MIETRAVVVRAEKGRVWVRLLERHGGCGRCDEPGGCHAPQFAEMFRGSDKTLAIDDPLGFCVDDRVRIVIDEGTPLRAALSSYGLGTALVLAGAALGVWVAPVADLGAVAGLVSGCAISMVVLRIRARQNSSWRLRIERDDTDDSACAGQHV